MLTDVQIRKAKPAEKAYKLTDGAGLHLFVTTSGSRLWRYRYEIAGKEKLLSIGPYPEVTLADARESRDEARALLRKGQDPGLVKRAMKAGAGAVPTDTFEAVAREWYASQEPLWAKGHAARVIASLEHDVFPTIGAKSVRTITAPEILAFIRNMEKRGASETAKRVRQRLSAVFSYAIATGRASVDPASAIKTVLAPAVRGRQPAITDLFEARIVLERVEATPSHPVTRLAMRLLALTVVRPGTLASTPWSEFSDLAAENPVWQVPAARMKLRLAHKEDDARAHLVPLSRQAVETIEAIRILTGRGPYVVPNGRSAHKPMSENALGYLLNRAGYHHRHVPHGWRATFSTVMNERFPADRAVIDLMLAHVPKDKVESAYNRAAHLARRRELAQLWADLIMEGRPAATSLLTGRRRGFEVPAPIVEPRALVLRRA